MRGLRSLSLLLRALALKRLAHHALVAGRDVATGAESEVGAHVGRFILLVAGRVPGGCTFEVAVHLATHNFVEGAHLHTALLLLDVVAPPAALASDVLLRLRPSTSRRR